MKQPVHRHIRAYNRTGAGLVLGGLIRNRLMKILDSHEPRIIGFFDHAIFPPGNNRLRDLIVND